jgi:protein involved in sex pheromone biosynthesis
MRIMILTLASIITGGLFSLMLSGCGDKDSDTAEEVTEAEEEEVEAEEEEVEAEEEEAEEEDSAAGTGGEEETEE